MPDHRDTRRNHSGGKDAAPVAKDATSGRHHPYSRDVDRNFGKYDEKIENKLYVGNLDHRITEYHVIKMFTPFGKIRREEYLWHTHGPRRGEPRGYAFVEYATRKEADLAKAKMNGKLAFGRPLVVRFVDEKITSHNADAPLYGKDDACFSDAIGARANPTVLTAAESLSASRSAKIAAIQNKLKALEKGAHEGSKPRATPPVSDGGLPPVTSRVSGGNGGGSGVLNLGEISERGRDVQTKTLLQTGQRWSSWN